MMYQLVQKCDVVHIFIIGNACTRPFVIQFPRNLPPYAISHRLSIWHSYLALAKVGWVCRLLHIPRIVASVPLKSNFVSSWNQFIRISEISCSNLIHRTQLIISVIDSAICATFSSVSFGLFPAFSILRRREISQN